MERDFDKMKLPVLKEICSEYDLPIGNKDEMIAVIKLFDAEKYIYAITQIAYGKDNFLIGIALNDKIHLNEISKMVFMKEAKNIGRYCDNRIHFISDRKLI